MNTRLACNAMRFRDDDREDVAAMSIHNGSYCDTLKVRLETSASRNSRLRKVHWRRRL